MSAAVSQVLDESYSDAFSSELHVESGCRSGDIDTPETMLEAVFECDVVYVDTMDVLDVFDEEIFMIASHVVDEEFLASASHVIDEEISTTASQAILELTPPTTDLSSLTTELPQQLCIIAAPSPITQTIEPVFETVLSMNQEARILFHNCNDEMKAQLSNGSIADLIFADLLHRETPADSTPRTTDMLTVEGKSGAEVVDLIDDNVSVQSDNIHLSDLDIVVLEEFEQQSSLLLNFSDKLPANSPTHAMAIDDVFDDIASPLLTLELPVGKMPTSIASLSHLDDDPPPATTLDPLLQFIVKITPLQGEELHRALVIHYFNQIDYINVKQPIILDTDAVEELCGAVMSATLESHAYIVFDAVTEALDESRLYILSTRRNACAMGCDMTELLIERARGVMDMWFRTCIAHDKPETAVCGAIARMSAEFEDDVDARLKGYEDLLIEGIVNDVLLDAASAYMD